jgi:hypothetical protein
MIGGGGQRRVVTAIVVALLVGVGLGLRSADPLQADPPTAAARARSLAAAAVAADEALARLSAVLADAIDHGRRGSAQTVAGNVPPATELEAAAARLVAGAGAADAARRAVTALAGMAAAVVPRAQVPALSYSGPDLLLIADSLRTSADDATLFVQRRDATQAVVSVLGDAVVQLESDQPEAALVSLDRAAAPVALLDAWQLRPPLLSYWMKVTRDLLDAARGIATATIDGDPAAVRAAAARYATAGAAARGADNALAVSLSEEGAAVSGIPLRRLAAAASRAADLRAAVQPLMRGGS